MHTPADQREAQPEGEVGPHDPRGVERGETEQATVPSAPAPEDEKPTSAPTGNIARASQPRTLLATALRVADENDGRYAMGRQRNHGAQREVEPECCADTHERWKQKDPSHHTGHPGEQHDAKRAPDHLASPDLDGNDHQLDRSGIDERGTDRFRDRYVEKRISSGAVMVPAPTPVIAMRRQSRSPVEFHGNLLQCLNVNAALQFVAGPAAGAGIVGIEGQAGTWLAADAGVALRRAAAAGMPCASA